ncbi:MAG: SDR family NAD(P)-dependent oxidoreductase [Alphaproteobacteria bacterium]
MRNQVVTPEDGIAWVTGASSGIGYHTALELAREGWTVAVTGRREEELRTLCAAAEQLQGDIVAFPGDITDSRRMLAIVTQAEVACAPVALAVFAAGAYEPVNAAQPDPGPFERCWETNVMGTLNGLEVVVPRMIERGRGHIAIVSSIAAYGGLPGCAAYGASMAALSTLAENLKLELDPYDVRVSLVTPGFVKAPAHEALPFPRAFRVGGRAAAKRIVAGLKRQGFETSFPKRLTWAFRLLRSLPRDLYFTIVKRNVARAQAEEKESGGDGRSAARTDGPVPRRFPEGPPISPERSG